MKLVKAIIRPDRFGFVRRALEENGFLGMTITVVEGYDGQHVRPHDNCEGLMPFDLLPRIQIELVVNNSNVDHLVSTIAESGHTGYPGDGWVFVMQVDKTIRIRTGESLGESQMSSTTDTAAYDISDFRSAVTEGSGHGLLARKPRIAPRKKGRGYHETGKGHHQA